MDLNGVILWGKSVYVPSIHLSVMKFTGNKRLEQRNANFGKHDIMPILASMIADKVSSHANSHPNRRRS